jgi:murein DD-endopeptidase MepM/ murein hydrolase activator NlpD
VLGPLLEPIESSTRWLQTTLDDRLSRQQWAERDGAAARALHTAVQIGQETASALRPSRAEKPASVLTDALLSQPPVAGLLTSPFGVRRDPIRRRRKKHHKGIDLKADRGTPVRAAGPGIVLTARRSKGYGRLVIIDHGLGLETRYAHLQRIRVKKGEFVPRGSIIGNVGSSGRATGPHLHFEVRQDGVAVPPGDVVDFELPPCAADARDCDPRPTPRI